MYLFPTSRIFHLQTALRSIDTQIPRLVSTPISMHLQTICVHSFTDQTRKILLIQRKRICVHASQLFHFSSSSLIFHTLSVHIQSFTVTWYPFPRSNSISSHRNIDTVIGWTTCFDVCVWYGWCKSENIWFLYQYRPSVWYAVKTFVPLI